MNLLGRNIGILRTERHLTQIGLASNLRVSPEAVSEWEQGESIPEDEQLLSIARYFGVTAGQLLNEAVLGSMSPIAPDFSMSPQVDKEPEDRAPRVKTSLGVLFLIPMFVVLLVVFILPLINKQYRAFTDFNFLETPKFVGLNNYIKLFSQDKIFGIALKNTIQNTLFVMLAVGFLVVVCSWLIRPAHKAIRYIVFLLFNLVSVSVLAGGMTFLFSGDAYGFLNSCLLESGKITEPIQFLSTYAPQIQSLLFFLILFGPVLTAVSLIKPRQFSGNQLMRLLFPLKHSLQVYVAGVLPVLLMPICWGTSVSTFGFPSANYAVHTTIDHFFDYNNIRFDIGYASAINVVSLLLTAVLLVGFLVLSCSVMHLVAYVKSKGALVSNTSGIKKSEARRVTAYLVSSVLFIGALFWLFPLFLLVMNSCKDVSEIFMFPQQLFPQKYSTRNYTDLFVMDMGNYRFSQWLFNMAVVPLCPAIVLTAVCCVSAYGVAYFEYSARRILYILILLIFLLLPLALLPDYTNTWMVNHVLPLGMYAAFSGPALLVGFVYFKWVIEKARQHCRRLFLAVPLNCIPVILITYVMCFVNPYVNGLLYNKPSFTLYYFIFQSGGVARLGIDSAAKVVLIGITFGFLLVAAVTAMAFFPRRKKKAN